MIALLSGPLLKIAGPILALALFVGAGWLALHERDGRLRAEAQMAQAQANQVAIAQEAAAHQAALETSLRAQIARAASTATIKERIAHAAPSVACTASPAVRTALDGLRNATPANGVPADPHNAAGVQPPTGRAR